MNHWLCASMHECTEAASHTIKYCVCISLNKNGMNVMIQMGCAMCQSTHWNDVGTLWRCKITRVYEFIFTCGYDEHTIMRNILENLTLLASILFSPLSTSCPVSLDKQWPVTSGIIMNVFINNEISWKFTRDAPHELKTKDKKPPKWQPQTPKPCDWEKMKWEAMHSRPPLFQHTYELMRTHQKVNFKIFTLTFFCFCFFFFFLGFGFVFQ